MPSCVYSVSIDVCYDVVLYGYILCLHVCTVYPSMSVMMWCSVDTFCAFMCVQCIHRVCYDMVFCERIILCYVILLLCHSYTTILYHCTMLQLNYIVN